MKLSNPVNEQLVYSKMSLDRFGSGTSPPAIGISAPSTNIYFVLQLISIAGFLISLFNLPPTHGEEPMAIWDLAVPVLCSSFLTLAGVSTFLAVRREFQAALSIWKGVVGVHKRVKADEHYPRADNPGEKKEGTVAVLRKGSKLWIALFAVASLKVVLLAMTAPAVAVLISSNAKSSSCVSSAFHLLSVISTKTSLASTALASWTIEKTTIGLSGVLELIEVFLKEMAKRLELTKGLSTLNGLSSDSSVTTDFQWHLQNVASLIRQITFTASDCRVWKVSKTTMHWFFLLGEKVVKTKPHIVDWSVFAGISTFDVLRKGIHMFANDVAQELIQPLILTLLVAGVIVTLIDRNIFHRFSKEFRLSCWVTVAFHILSLHSTAYISAESAIYFVRQQGWTNGNHIPTWTLQFMLTVVSVICGVVVGIGKPPPNFDSETLAVEIVRTKFSDIMSSTFNSTLLLSHGSQEIMHDGVYDGAKDTSRSSESLSSLPVTTKSRPPSGRDQIAISEEQDGDLFEAEEVDEDLAQGEEEDENHSEDTGDERSDDDRDKVLSPSQASSERDVVRPRSSTDIEDDNEPTTTSGTNHSKVEENAIQPGNLDIESSFYEDSASNLSSEEDDPGCTKKHSRSASSHSLTVEGDGQKSGRDPRSPPLLSKQLLAESRFPMNSSKAFGVQSASVGLSNSSAMTEDKQPLIQRCPTGSGSCAVPRNSRICGNQPVSGIRRNLKENLAPKETNGECKMRPTRNVHLGSQVGRNFQSERTHV